MIISRTPFRISFFGGGTDFPEFYNEHGGACLATAIDKFSYISIHTLAPFFSYRFHASYAQTELVNHPGEFKHPLIRECLLMLGIESGLEIMHVSDLPGRTGLGTSSSFTVGLLNGLHHFAGRPTTPEVLAREAIAVERERVGDAGGHQDQYAAAYGGLLRMDFANRNQVRVRPLALETGVTTALQEHLLLFYTGMQQAATALQEEQRRLIANNLTVLHDLRDMVDRAETILRGGEPLTEFGLLLHEAWKRKKTLASGISNSLVDQAYESALATGALGGKLLGAGGRGFLLLFAKPGKQQRIREALTDLREVSFAFYPKGSGIIFESSEQVKS